jgi:hypothetical protein
MADTNQDKPEETTKPKTTQTKATWQDITTAVVGLLALLGFGWFIIYLTQQATDPKLDEVVWTRMTYLLTGVEAIAFAAAGYFFGKEVHRKQAESAESRADAASEQASVAEERATEAETKGKTLRKALAASMKQPKPRGDIEAFGSSDEEKDISYLVDLAEQLFPD